MALQKRSRALPAAVLLLGRRHSSREGNVGGVAGSGRHFTRKPCFTRQPNSPTNPAKEALHQSVVPWVEETCGSLHVRFVHRTHVLSRHSSLSAHV